MLPLNGSILLQVRSLPTILQTCSLFQAGSHRLPTPVELAEYLSFLSLLCIAPSFRYDATVPDSDVNEFLSAASGLHLSARVSPLEPATGEDFIKDAANAIAFAAAAMNRSLNEGDFSVGHKRLPDKSVSAFRSALRAITQTPDREARIALSLTAFNEGITGAKCLLGMAAQNDTSLLVKTADAFNRFDGAAVQATLIDHFRPYLMLAWGGREGSVFACGERIVDNLNAHYYQLWKDLQHRIGFHANQELVSYMQTSIRFPMLGVVLLMTAPPSARPIDLVSHAIESRESLGMSDLATELWKLRWTSSPSLAALRATEIADELWLRVSGRQGPKREDLRSFWQVATSAVAPQIAAPTGAATAQIHYKPENVLEQLAALGGEMAALSPFALLRALKMVSDADRPAAALSNMVALYRAEFPRFESQVKKLWRRSDA